jgi:CRP-like cAMP-binding protein
LNAPDNVSRNRLLAMLSPANRTLLASALEEIGLTARQIVEAPNEPIDHVYFVESGLVSVVGTATDKHRIEIGMVGYEGMTGLSVVLGDDRSANEALVQSSGIALRITAAGLRERMAASHSLTADLLRYVSVFMVQAGQTALANGRGRLDERLARWLLMWDDRLRPSPISVTHDFLGLLLGVRRTGVTATIAVLEGKGLIRATRAKVSVRDRKGLKLLANGFYGIPEAEYDRLLGAEYVS